MRSLTRFVSRLRFLLHATNHHGVHSPFVFKYLTRCLYRKGFRNRTKFERILLKSIPYFGYKSLHLPGQNNLDEILKQENPNVYYNRPPYDMVVLKAGQLKGTDLNDLVPLCHNDSAIFVEDFRRTKEELAVWERFCEDLRVTVSIDCFFGGILFFRKEQVKQHFRIRI